jgi:putative two-component system response regulator
VLIGVDIALPLQSAASVVPIIRHHHEHFDGSGYPDGLRGEEIPLAARIVAVCDAYDAMISDRPYRAAMSSNSAGGALLAGAGTQWDPKLVKLFITTVLHNPSGLPAQGAQRPLSFSSM